MTAQYSPRHALPLLTTAQAQKEITHNEALILIDALLHPFVQGRASEPPTLTESDQGKCWLVDEIPAGSWTSHSSEIACWTGGSWRFLKLSVGARIFDDSSQSYGHLTGSGWLFAPEIATPIGGAVVDSEAREVIELLLEHLRAVGVVMGGA